MVLAAVARVAEKDGLAKSYVEKLLEFISDFDEFMEGLGFCLSEEPDQLSQWRGYADDGAGVAIGYSKEYLDALASYLGDQGMPSFTVGKVEYEMEKHDAHVEPTYRKAREFIDQGVFDFPGVYGLLDPRSEKEKVDARKRWQQLFRNMYFTMFSLLFKLYLLKSPAFQEEREWRLIAYLNKNGNDECEFHVKRDRIVPYKVFKLHELNVMPVNEVVLGPKHITPISVIKDLLRKSGYGEVKVSKSAASYR